MSTNTHELFYKLVRSGLWEDNVSADIQNQGFTEPVDWEKVYQLATEQSVLGLVLAGIERQKRSWPSQAAKPSAKAQWGQEVQGPDKLTLLQWIGEVQIQEQQNKEMNMFIAELVMKMRSADIYTLLVKGQGVAQCYERPLWRSSGDVDLLLSADNYEKAKLFLTPLAEHVDPEDTGMKHLGMNIDKWIVELHGTMHTEISRRVNMGIDEVQNDCFYRGNVRSWNNNGTVIFLPSPDNDVIFVFTHILQHFFIEGVGLRQVCDWCRLLWTYRDSLDCGLLESRIKRMGLMTEWKTFASLAVDVLGMPEGAMPFYDVHFHKKGQCVLSRIMKSGNMGHNNDLSYRAKYSGLTYKFVALWRRVKDFASFTKIFPLDAPKFFVYYVMRKV